MGLEFVIMIFDKEYNLWNFLLRKFLYPLLYYSSYGLIYVVGPKSFRPGIQKSAKWKMLWGIYSAIYELLVHRCEKRVEIKEDYVEK